MPRLARAQPRRDALTERLLALDALLTPDPRPVAEAQSRASKLIQELHQGRAWMFEVRALRPHGSLSRGTAIHPLHDLDVLVLLNKSTLRTTQDLPRSAKDTVERMAKAIRDRRAGLVSQGFMDVRSQGHSVGVSYKSGLRIDLVPAISDRWHTWIPRRRTDEWIRTDPAKAEERLDAASRVSPAVRSAVRLLKGWRRARGRSLSLPSYGVEVLVVEQASQRRQSLPELVLGFFSTFADHDARRQLVLVGGCPQAAPVMLKDPSSEANLAEDLDAAARRAWVDASRRTLESLEEVQAKLQPDPHARVDSVLKSLFIGRH